MAGLVDDAMDKAFLGAGWRFPVALGAALLVHGRKRTAGILALLLILPWAVAPIGDGLLWRLLFDPAYGIVGKLIRYLHLPPIRVHTPEGAFFAGQATLTAAAC